MLIKNKILLSLMPYWSPLIPPLGIACLKGFLQEHNYKVKAVDANVNIALRKVYDSYFETLAKLIPENKRPNFIALGMNVMRHQLMAHLNYENEEDYINIVERLIFNTFFYESKGNNIRELINIVDDFYTSLEGYIRKLLSEEKPEYFGISTFNGSLPATIFAFKTAKKILPEIRTVIGGGVFSDELEPSTINFQNFVNKTSYIDHIIIGEGELPFLRLLDGTLSKNQKVIKSNHLNEEKFNIENAALPDFTDFDLDFYPYLASYASRSCPFQCSFCSETLNWGKYKRKSGRKIATELSELFRIYGSTLFLMGDSLLNPVISDMSKGILNDGLNIYWDGYLRSDSSVSLPENVELWRKAGFYRARLGVESGSNNVLNLMNKKITVDEVRQSVSNLAQAGIKTTTYWIAGHPGETEEDFQQTLDLLYELQDDIWEAECAPFTFYNSGQVNSNYWRNNEEVERTYSNRYEELLMLSIWKLNTEPSQEEIHNRLIRFEEHCKKLEIPNPNTMLEINFADERWNKLHENSVPPLLDILDYA